MWVKSLIGSKPGLSLSAAASTCDRHAAAAERVAVGLRARQRLRADQPAAAGAVLDHELLAERLPEVVGVTGAR